mmetsp:Transcript_112067/g.322119  ORF Transcript_112067/g.322119 Transcript_112067/m.322119 type:complete len:279 (-) Transcript_112067:14-850(-)
MSLTFPRPGLSSGKNSSRKAPISRIPWRTIAAFTFPPQPQPSAKPQAKVMVLSMQPHMSTASTSVTRVTWKISVSNKRSTTSPQAASAVPTVASAYSPFAISLYKFGPINVATLRPGNVEVRRREIGTTWPSSTCSDFTKETTTQSGAKHDLSVSKWPLKNSHGMPTTQTPAPVQASAMSLVALKFAGKVPDQYCLFVCWVLISLHNSSRLAYHLTWVLKMPAFNFTPAAATHAMAVPKEPPPMMQTSNGFLSVGVAMVSADKCKLGNAVQLLSRGRA